jgi:uncharacterized membrane protein HdeD (DUF308 family)
MTMGSGAAPELPRVGDVSWLTRHWWAMVLRGVLAIIFGIMVIAWPGIALQTLVLLFGAYMLVDGVFAIAGALTHRSQYKHWWLALLEGLVGVVVGILTFIYPGITALTLLYLIAIWAIITGVFELMAAIRLREEIDNEWFLALTGIASLLFGALILLRPGTGVLAVLSLIAGYAIVFGVLMIILGLRLRTWTPTSRRGTTATTA